MLFEKDINISPDIEVVIIETEQNVLVGGSGDVPNIPGEPFTTVLMLTKSQILHHLLLQMFSET